MEREYSTASDADSQTVLQNKNKAAQKAQQSCCM
jgi:hypothetical protein